MCVYGRDKQCVHVHDGPTRRTTYTRPHTAKNYAYACAQQRGRCVYGCVHKNAYVGMAYPRGYMETTHFTSYKFDVHARVCCAYQNFSDFLRRTKASLLQPTHLRKKARRMHVNARPRQNKSSIGSIHTWRSAPGVRVCRPLLCLCAQRVRAGAGRGASAQLHVDEVVPGHHGHCVQGVRNVCVCVRACCACGWTTLRTRACGRARALDMEPTADSYGRGGRGETP